ncbi:ion transporter [Fibrella forsythiae]|uniref:Ion transporter n=1 Tax=Fibrella forsythiae TaxID=2817061 RepID=A0ABS3JPI0_9BACT|nr:ion transporter [Fibrella forsythiae]MBO0951909.1 ion transporter [Fibrella forsythiae]
MSPSTPEKPRTGWRTRLHEVIFEADTAAGKAFDIGLIASILLSVTTVMLESVPSIRTGYGDVLTRIEWFFTILFTIEYLLRLVSVEKPLRYTTSFFGFVDILALLPTYLSLFLPGTQYLFTIRILRLLRVFRILKLSEYLSEASTLMGALHASRRKISVFILTVLLLVVIIGSMMYIVEGEEHGFDSIPTSIYWAIVTLTTVGYGDLSPQTPLGKTLASLVMIMGYGIIAVPTGIVTAELSQVALKSKQVTSQACPNCSQYGHDADALFCKYCGSHL